MIVSDRALMSLLPILTSRLQAGTSPLSELAAHADWLARVDPVPTFQSDSPAAMDCVHRPESLAQAGPGAR